MNGQTAGMTSGGRRAWHDTPVARDPEAGKLGGVVAGLTRAYGFDLRTTRIAVTIATCVLPVLVAVYAAAWLLLPSAPDQARPLRDVLRDRRRAPLLIAIGIVVVAGGIGSLGSWVFFGGLPWGLALIALGVLLWARPDLLSYRTDGGTNAGGTPGGPWPAPAPTGDLTTDPGTELPVPTTDAVAKPADPASTTADRTALARSAGDSGTSTLPPRVERLAVRRRWRPVGPAALLVTFAVVGALAAGTALGWWHTSILAGAITASLLLFVGAFLTGVVNRRWTAVFGLLWYGAAASFLLTVRPNLDGGAGERTLRPATIAEAQDRTRMAAGRLTLDLTSLPTTDATALDVRADLGFGQLVIDVPADAVLEVDATVGAGGVHLDGRRLGTGLRVHDHWTDTPTLTPGKAVGRTISMHLDVGAGEVRIRRAVVAP